MRRILIIGNGFDLYHKLPTGYKDFLFFTKHWDEFKYKYDEQEKSEDNKADELINVRLGSRNELTAESLNDFAKYAYMYSKEHIVFLDNNVRENAWLEYFQKITLPGQNWIDFEEEIYRALLQVELIFTEILAMRNESISWAKLPYQIRMVIQYFFNYKERQQRRYYRFVVKWDALRDDHVGKWDALRDADPEDRNLIKAQVLDFMKDELDILNKCLAYYFIEFVSKINCGVYSEQIKNLGDVRLLNFNYTYTFPTVYRNNILVHHHFIHGEAKEENLVFGISDESFGDSMDYIYFQKFFQRIQKKTGSFYKRWLMDEDFFVYIMGHSLNKVDKGVLQDFFLDEIHVPSITIFYHSQSGYENLIINLVDMFGREFVIDQTGRGRIVFEELKPPVKGELRN